MNDISYQRWLALGLLVLVILLIIFLAIVPLVSTGLDYHDQKNDLAFRLWKSEQIIAKKESVAENIEKIKQQYLSQNYFSTRSTVAQAQADQLKFIKSTISDAGGQQTSTQVIPSSDKNGFKRVTVKVRMSGDMEVLRNVLYEIESSVPLMVIDQIDIRPVRGRRNRKTREIEPSSILNVNFQASGFMRANPSS